MLRSVNFDPRLRRRESESLTYHSLLFEGAWIASARRENTGDSMGNRTETSLSEPLTFLTLPATRPSAMHVYLARTRSACVVQGHKSANLRHLRKGSDNATHPSEGTETNLEKRVNVVRDDLGSRLSKHAERDDRSSALEPWNLFRGACETKQSPTTGTKILAPRPTSGVHDQRLTVHLPELVDDFVVDDTSRHHDCEESLERRQFCESRVSRQPGADKQSSAKK